MVWNLVLNLTFGLFQTWLWSGWDFAMTLKVGVGSESEWVLDHFQTVWTIPVVTGQLRFLQSFSFGIMTNVFKCSSLQRTNIHAPLHACLTSTIRPTFRCVPVNKGVYQRPAFAIVGGSQLQPISLQSTDHVAFPGNTHGECPLVVLTAQRVQRSTARSPWVEEDQQPQIWKEKEQKYDSFYHFS